MKTDSVPTEKFYFDVAKLFVNTHYDTKQVALNIEKLTNPCI